VAPVSTRYTLTVGYRISVASGRQVRPALNPECDGGVPARLIAGAGHVNATFGMGRRRADGDGVSICFVDVIFHCAAIAWRILNAA